MSFWQRSFSLTDVIVVVIVIAVILAVAMPRLTGRYEKNRRATAREDILVNIPEALKLYELDNGFLPKTPQGLSALLQKPTVAPIPENWNGPYLRKSSVDPWGRPYQYRYPGVHRPHSYDLYSSGKNPGPEMTKDDVVNWAPEPSK